MRFPHAHAGVKKIYTAELPAVIATVAILVTAIITLALSQGGGAAPPAHCRQGGSRSRTFPIPSGIVYCNSQPRDL